MKSHDHVVPEYKIEVGASTYAFHDVALQKSASGKWTLTVGIIEKMKLAICAVIFSEDTQLTCAELEFVAKVAKLNMSDIAKLLKVDKSTVSKWRKDSGLVPYADSFVLKNKLPEIIFSDRRTGQAYKFWITSQNLPTPTRLAS